jgi:hypothetical protein
MKIELLPILLMAGLILLPGKSIRSTQLKASGIAGETIEYNNYPLAGSEKNQVRLVNNELPLGADVDIIDYSGNKLFRLLIPESVTAVNYPGRSFLSHRIPGEWGESNGIRWCKLKNDGWVEAIVAFHTLEKGVLILFGLRNLSGSPLEQVGMDICVAVSHIPCPHGSWVNKHFVPVPEPPDRDSAGCYWYEKVAPSHLKALINGEWMIAHRDPGNPACTSVPKYQPFIYLDLPASIMAAESMDGKERIFEAWNTECRVRCAFPGNSCMHLEPILAKKLLPSQLVFINGEISVTRDSWSEISKWNPEKYRKEFETMKKLLDKLN